ncbi:hypothetical protein Vadar_029821 [Vaccinium darrowii]|uniref:Uncharacterized protein n=1 Tax=Vaccinium darrowii TaxID=229202 RepID=A0ACB7Y3F5_9ERIC|nr:hypothetical protein Vadar_029821 [Vaccinium darrowii]
MASSPKKIILKSIDGETFEVDKAVALQMQPINYPIEEDCADTFFPVPNVKGSILSKVIEYCKMHADDHVSNVQLKSFDAQFVNVEQEVLFDLIRAANYLGIKGLLDMTCQTVADMIKGKTPAEIRRTFNLRDQFTPEEEEEVRRENAWAFE